MNKIKTFSWSIHNGLFLPSIISTFFWGLIAHTYGFLNLFLTHDAVWSFYSGTFFEKINLLKIQTGRWFVPIYHTIFRGPITLPWLIGLTSLLWIAIAVYFCSKTLGIKSKTHVFLLAAFMTTNVTITSQSATYIYELDCNMFALLMACIAAYMWKSGTLWYHNLVGIITTAIVLGIYQSYLSVIIALIIIDCILELLNNEKPQKTIIKGLKGCAIIIAGSLIYLCINKLFTLIYSTHLDDTSYNSLSNILKPFEGGFIKYILKMYLTFAYRIFAPASFYSIFLMILSVILLCVIGTFAFIKICKHNKLPVSNIILVLLLVLLLPCGMNISDILNKSMSHDLMRYSFCFFYFMLFIIIHLALKNEVKNTKTNAIIKTTTYTIIALVLLNNIQVSNAMYINKELQQNATLSQMTIVLSDMQDYPDFNVETMPVVFMGQSSSYIDVAPFDSICRITGFSPDVSSDNKAHHYFRYVLNYPILSADIDIIDSMADNQEVIAMPSYPEQGYIKVVDNILVVKISDYIQDEIYRASLPMHPKEISNLIQKFSG
ncbi:MAG: glucosyltransferase domain-containing protein [Ruminococcus sp.]|nr:glucosyltransferase domain-containing protein [Ruminococcus sp.]